MSSPDLCFATSSLRKSLSRRCRFSIASSTVKRGRTPRNSATSPRQVFRSIDDRRALRQPRELDAAVDRHRRRAGAALGAEERVRDARRLGAGGGRLAARGGAADRAVERLFRGARGLRSVAGVPGEELVRAGAHGLKDQVRLGGRRDREDRQARAAWRAGARSPPCPTRRRCGCRRRRGRAALQRFGLDDADRHAAGAQEPRDLPFEFLVVADDLGCELGHGNAAFQETRNRNHTHARRAPLAGKWQPVCRPSGGRPPVQPAGASSLAARRRPTGAASLLRA